ncbi:putative ABC transport system ATP-binding protein [Paenibacillus castaneae]|uniref:ABC transporter ATP-binding protein n=1 Tax=Paenibacillus castaneae TaxID=474957 RepID=UPI001FD22058|nr:ATP-binding cassette domain-containing protein [Paenibacillus castaneae]NIK79618.1 putative ABC transport system ATP-binding protein [Paenibacillus castaneae]
MKPVFHMQQLRKKHEGKENQALFANVTAEIADPTVIALLGVSGQGKSTLLRILASLEHADEGDIGLHNISQREMDPRLWRMKVCYVAQQSVMLTGSIEHNLKTVSLLHRIPYEDKLVNHLLPRLGLDHLDLSKSALELSGGEKQRISLLRALLLHPEVLLLDEITASLDRSSKQMVEQVLQEWHQQEGTTMIWVTHDIEQAKQISQTVWFMGEGTLLENCSTEAFFEQPATELARNYVQAPSVSYKEDPCPF